MPTLPPHDRHVDVLEMNEAFEEVNGLFGFAGTLVVYQADGKLYHAVSKARYSSPSEVKAEHLKDIINIPVSAYSPPASSELTRAPDPLPRDCYVKKPRLISYDRICRGPRPELIAESVLAEAKVCEQLMRHPHPNVATYLGCQVSDGRITGLCFARYQRTLMQEVNPHNLSKRRSRSARRATGNYGYIPVEIESGIKHIHSLGLVHNDINPKNVMLNGDRVVLIDFDSCRPVGDSLEGVGRTYEWYDENVQLSVPKNDFDALAEIRAWLGDDSETFRFDE
jgi:serine/threonine protein kinase